MKKLFLLLILALGLSSCTIDVDLVGNCEYFEHIVRDDLGRIIDVSYQEVCYY